MSRQYRSNFTEKGTIGCGGFSTVFKAKSLNDGKLYAIKKVPFNKNKLNDVLRETSFLFELQSDYIVRYFDSWVENNYYLPFNEEYGLKRENILFDTQRTLLLHIQMEVCSMNLKHFIDNNIEHDGNKNTIALLKYNECCKIFIQLLNCVQYLHNYSIIHRDLSLANTMLNEHTNGLQIKLTDFGLSTYHDYPNQPHTIGVGRPRYMAPETRNGNYDTKADIYSLGIIMEELFNLDIDRVENDTNEQIQSKYVKAKKIVVNCLSAQKFKRPDCSEILRERYLWDYDIEFELNFNKQKWPILFGKGYNLFCKSKLMSVYEKREEKAIFISNDRKIFALDLNHSDTTKHSVNPTQIEELKHKKIMKMVCGQNHVLLLTSENMVYSFGSNKFGQLGHTSGLINNRPTNISELNDKHITDIKCGCYHSLALDAYGKVYSWGGSIYNIDVPIPRLITAFNLEKVIQIGCGKIHCLALTNSGKLYEWVVGNEQTEPSRNPIDEQIEIKMISCGDFHSLVLSINGEIYFCDKYSNKVFKKIETEIKFLEIEAHKKLSMGLSIDGKLYFGSVFQHQSISFPIEITGKSFEDIKMLLLNESNFSQEVFVTKPGRQTTNLFSKFQQKWKQLKNVNQASISCLMIANLTECEGIFVTNDGCYTLRLSDSIEEHILNQINNEEKIKSRVKSIICGFYNVFCLDECGNIFSLRANECDNYEIYEQNIHNNNNNINIEVYGKNIKEISGGVNHFLALSDSGVVYSFGDGRFGQLGNAISFAEPTNILNQIESLNATKICQIACGAYHCLALCSDNQLYGWGLNTYGQIGITTMFDLQYEPQLIVKQDDFKIKKISCGKYHSLLLTDTNVIYSFGCNEFGELGIGNQLNQTYMTKLEIDICFIDISATFCDCISAAKSSTGQYYVWGQFGHEVISTPIRTDLTSFDGIFAKYSKYRFTANEILDRN